MPKVYRVIIAVTMGIEVNGGYSVALPHLHTVESDGMVTSNQLFSDIAQAKEELGINIVGGYTNHDTIKGMEPARRAADYFGIEMIPGQEITVGRFPPKHILALFPEDPQGPIRPAKTVEGTIDKIKENDGLVIAAHPDAFRGIASLTSSEMRNLGNRDLIDGLEVISGTYNREERLQPIAKELGKTRPVAQIGSSDSHFGSKDLLTAITIFKGKTVEDFFEAVKKGETVALPGIMHTVRTRDRVVQNLYSNIVLNVRRLMKSL